MSFEKVIQEVNDMGTVKKLQLAVDCYEQLHPFMQKCDPTGNGMRLFSVIVGTAAAADNCYPSVEKCAFVSALYSSFFGVSLDEADILALIKTCHDMNAETYKLVKQFADALDTKRITDLISFLAVIFLIDEKISREEYEFLTKLTGRTIGN